ncbi:MAG: hypothetical protein ACYC97_11190 [Metallibacterium sp.]
MTSFALAKRFLAWIPARRCAPSGMTSFDVIPAKAGIAAQQRSGSSSHTRKACLGPGSALRAVRDDESGFDQNFQR